MHFRYDSINFIHKSDLNSDFLFYTRPLLPLAQMMNGLRRNKDAIEEKAGIIKLF